MTDLFNMLATYLHDVFVIKFDGWVILGFVAQGFFTMRFVVQWIASERARKSVIPVAFWFFSIGGGVLLLIYALYRRDPVFIAGQALGLVVYFRNLYFIIVNGRQSSAKRLRVASERSPCERQKCTRDPQSSALKAVPMPRQTRVAIRVARSMPQSSNLEVAATHRRLVGKRQGTTPRRSVRTDGESRPVPDRPSRRGRCARQLWRDCVRRAGDRGENRAVGTGERVRRAADDRRVFSSADLPMQDQRAAWLPRIAAGEVCTAVAISEPGAGAHPKHLQTTAESRGAGFVIARPQGLGHQWPGRRSVPGAGGGRGRGRPQALRPVHGAEGDAPAS